MMFKTTTSLAFAAACLTAVATMPAHSQMAGTYGSTPGYNGPQSYQGSTSPNYAPQSNQGDMPSSSAGMSGPRANHRDLSSSASAQRNVIQSQQYDRRLETDHSYRQARMRKECGPITDPELRQSCLASFGQDEPYKGLSSSRRSRRS
ncbi:MAG: hypothetical protein WA633_11305 [Stellaceae bacterium]